MDTSTCEQLISAMCDLQVIMVSCGDKSLRLIILNLIDLIGQVIYFYRLADPKDMISQVYFSQRRDLKNYITKVMENIRSAMQQVKKIDIVVLNNLYGQINFYLISLSHYVENWDALTS
jgi:hypothetical protein